MGKAELLIGGLLVAIAGLGALARRLSIPYPIVLVVGGALFGFIPGLPAVNLDPNIVLVVFLPIHVYGAAFFANLAQVSITISLVSGYAAFVPASAVGASGVLAAVTTGIYMGVRGPSIIPARVRLQGFFAWDILDFIINSALFVLVGLQLRTIVQSLSDYSMGTLLGYGLAIAGVTVLTRMVWFFTMPYVVRALDRRPSQRDRRIPARNRFLLGWIGMRGAVSLAAALSIPLTVDSGAPFPDRDLILFLTFAVIFVTLIVQGLSLPAVIRRLHISDDGAAETEELKARLGATKAALAQIDALAQEDWTRDDTMERMRAAYEYRKRRLALGRARSRTTATRIARSSTSRPSRSCSGRSATRCDGSLSRSVSASTSSIPAAAATSRTAWAASVAYPRPWWSGCRCHPISTRSVGPPASSSGIRRSVPIGSSRSALTGTIAHSPIGEDSPATRSSRCRSRSRAVSSVVTVTRRGCGPSQRTTSSRE